MCVCVVCCWLRVVVRDVGLGVSVMLCVVVVFCVVCVVCVWLC